MAATFDNVYVNGSPFDDFEALDGMIDPTIWWRWEFVRLVDSGVYESGLTRRDVNGSNNLDVVDSINRTALRADVTVTDVINNGGRPQARVLEYIYNDGTPGDGRAGDIVGGVGILHDGSGLIGRAYVVRCLSGDCNVGSETQTLEVIDIAQNLLLDQTYTLTLAWDVNEHKLVFGIDNTTVSSTIALPAVAGPPRKARKSIGTRVSGLSGGEWGYIMATFDNVVDLTPPGLDGDGIPDILDPDDDNDGFLDFNDAFPLDPTEWADNDADLIGDNADPDDDNDGVLDDGDSSGVAGDSPCTGGNTTNCDDNCPTDVNPAQTDSDGDGQGDVCDVCPLDPADDVDSDGICGDVDNCPEDFNPGNPDLDGDGLGNACDPDADADRFGYVDFSATCCADYYAVYNGQTGALIKPYEGDPLALGEIRGGDCDDGDDSSLPGVGECPAAARGGNPNKGSGGDPTTDDADKDGRPDAQEVTSVANLAKLTDTLDGAADTDGDNVSDGSDDPDDTGPIVAGPDNCPRTSNPDQTNRDGDPPAAVNAVVGMATEGGDACDTDVDNDGRTDKRLASINSSGLLVFQDISNTDPSGDNCPQTPNTLQTNSDPDQLGDACDPDADNDTFADSNFSLTSPSYTGECCSDPETAYAFDTRTGEITGSMPYDGTLAANEVRGGDCDDTRNDVNPDQTEVIGDGVDNDCDTTTRESNYEIRVTATATPFTCTPSATHPCPNWLPTDGGTITLTADVVDVSTGSPVPATVNFFEDELTRFPGIYGNDGSEAHLIPSSPTAPCTLCDPDFVVTGTGNQRTLTSHDFGGKITMRMTAEYPAGSPLPPVIVNIPRDDNANYIGDDWEEQLASELAAAQAIDPTIVGLTQNGDHDFIVVDSSTGELNPTRGDGDTDHEEYRGKIWGPGVVHPNTGFQKLVKVTTVGPGQLYQSQAYLPMGPTTHFRTNPFRPDAYIKFRYYSVILDDRSSPTDLTYTPPYPLTPGDLEAPPPSCGVDCPFALGTALIDDAGADVHAVQADTTSGPQSVGEENIDVLVMTNDLTDTYGSETGHILRFGPRSFLTGTLGDCPVGDGSGLGPVIHGGLCRTFEKAIGYWFTDKTHRDGGRNYTSSAVPGQDRDYLLSAANNRNRVEDKNDDGIKGGGESSIVNDSYLDGDVYLRLEIAAGNYSAGDLGVHDIDLDGLIELPQVFDPAELATAHEYTRAHTTKVIATHEAIHGLGVGHTGVSWCLMFSNVNVLDKDDVLSPDAKRDLDIFLGR
jgi:hypothetical protein